MRTCLQCSKAVPIANRKFCSRACYLLSCGRGLTKRCVDCGRTPSQVKFNKHPATKDGLSTVCAPCNAARSRKKYEALSVGERTAANRLKYTSEAKRNSILMRKFGITLAQYENLLAKQQGKCKICSITFNSQKLPRVDHSHADLLVRGLLCNSCNLGLGYFRDSVEALRAAAKYVKAVPDPLIVSVLFAKGERRLDSRVMRTLKVSVEGRQRLLLLQNGACPICKVKLPAVQKCHLDHDHATGKIRGLLCSGCNHGLGAFYDDPVCLEAAALYIEEAR